MKTEDRKKLIFSVIVLGIIITLCVLLFFGFSKPKYDIVMSIDGKTYQSAKVKEGKKFSEPDEPKKEGYTFLGWFVNDKLFDFSEPITSDTKLVAKFKINTYTVSFDNDGVITKESVDYKNKVSEPSEPVKDGYVFLGWYKDDKLYDFNSLVKEDFTLYAKWEQDNIGKVTVLHYLMGTDGKYSSEPYLVEVLTGEIGSVVSPNTNTYTGFSSPVRSEARYSRDGETVSYYYERNRYSLGLSGGEHVSSVFGSGTYYYGEEVVVGAVLDKGYMFDSWSNGVQADSYVVSMPSYDLSLTAKPRSDTKYIVRKYLMDLDGNYGEYTDTVKEGVTDSEVTFSDSIVGFRIEKADTIKVDANNVNVLEVYYSRNKYNVSVKYEDGIDSVSGDGEYYYDKKITLNAKVKAGYKFDGWTLDGKVYSNDNPLEITVNEDMELVANAKESVFTVTFVNGKDKVTLVKGENSVIKSDEIPDTSKEGYSFVGWMKDGQEFDFDTPITSDITLVANYNINNNTIVFYSEDEVYEVLTGSTSESVNVPSDPTCKDSDYSFVGWFTKDGVKYDFSVNDKFSEDGLEVYARFRIITDIDEFIQDSISNSQMFTTSFDKASSKVSVVINDIYSKISSVSSLRDNMKKMMTDKRVSEVIVSYNGSSYSITKGNYESDFDNLIRVLTDTSSLDYSDRILKSLAYKDLVVRINLDSNEAMEENGNTSKEYSISFSAPNVISASEFSAFASKVLATIDNQNAMYNYNKYHIEVRGVNNVVMITKNRKSVITTLLHAGVRDNMYKLLSLNYIDHMVLTFGDMEEVLVADDVSSSGFYSKGMSILPKFASAVGMTTNKALYIKTYELVPLTVNCELVMSEGYEMDERIPLNYVINFEMIE